MTLSLSGDLVADRIGRLALVGWPDGEEVPRLDGFTPAGIPDTAVLLVRRVVVVSEPGAVQDAVHAELATAASTAARPARGYVDPGAEAVLFADSAQLLACYLLSLDRPWMVPAWVWTQLAGTLPPPSLTAVLGDAATPVAAVLASLDGWGRLPELVAGLDADVEERVVSVVAARHDLWVREVGRPTDPTGQPTTASTTRVRDVHAAPEPPPTWEVGRRGTSNVLAVVASGSRFPESLAKLVRVLLGTGMVSRAAVVDVVEGALPSAVLEATGATRAAPAHDPVSGVRETSTFESGQPDLGAGPARRPVQLQATGPAARAVVPMSDVPTAGMPADAVRDPEPPADAALDGVITDVGGVLYLVNCYEGLDLATYGLADAVPWDVVDGLGRAALAPVNRLDDPDPLWDLLAALAGRSPGERPAPKVLRACENALVTIVADLDLEPDEPTLADLLRVTGRIRVDHTRVDAYFPLDAVHLSVRRRALDADPGWMPTLGRVVRFHFVEGS